MTTPDEIAAIARGLSDGQKEALLNAIDLMNSLHGYPFLVVRHTAEPWPKGIAQFLSLRTDRLTKKGLAVRAYLETNP